MGQILEVNTERRERLEAQGDFAIAPEQQLSDIWHKALRNPDDTTQQENSARARYAQTSLTIQPLIPLPCPAHGLISDHLPRRFNTLVYPHPWFYVRLFYTRQQSIAELITVM